MTEGPARGDVVVEMTGIHRRFGSTVALDGVDLTLRKGEIHAVLGANGAGKTTLMRILAGLDSPDQGEVAVDGHHVDQFDPGAARRSGIALVQQHFTLVPTLSASENLLLARPLGRLRPSSRRLRRHLDELVDRFGLAVRDDVPVSALSVGEQQRLELLRALDANAEILVLDEPTAVLTDAEADQLLAVCRRLADDGHAIAIITHRLGEVFAGCDRVTVLRAGLPIIEDAHVSDLSRGDVATAMVGSESAGVLVAREHVPHETPDRHIRALSGGQQQRMFLARALMTDADVLLLDEPTSGLDVKTRHEVLHLLDELRQSGMAVLITTHDLNGIAAHLPHVVCLNGRVIGEGRPTEVLTPANLEATFGSPMQVLQHAGMPVIVDAPTDSIDIAS